MITRVEHLPIDLRQRIGSRDLVVFDGTCVLCSGFFRFMKDRAPSMQFATAQSPIGQALYRHLNLPLDDFETNLVITDGQIHQRLDAFAAAMSKVRGPFTLLRHLRWVPAWLKDPVYHLIARNRYRLFGRYDSCLIPDGSLRARFVDGGFSPAH